MKVLFLIYVVQESIFSNAVGKKKMFFGVHYCILPFVAFKGSNPGFLVVIVFLVINRAVQVFVGSFYLIWKCSELVAHGRVVVGDQTRPQ